MVIAKPIEFTMVRAVPLDSEMAFCATNVENNGESAMTTIPQKIRYPKNRISESMIKVNGDNRQQKHDKPSAMVAILFAPKV